MQAYVYAAKMRLAEIARMKKRLDLADRWQEEARNLKFRFNRDFWVENQDFCALALDGDGNPVDSLEFERSGTTTACRVAKKRGNLRVVIEA